MLIPYPSAVSAAVRPVVAGFSGSKKIKENNRNININNNNNDVTPSLHPLRDIDRQLFPNRLIARKDTRSPGFSLAFPGREVLCVGHASNDRTTRGLLWAYQA